MEKIMTIREFIKKFSNGEFDAKDVDTQIDAGWFDWFCKNSSLQKKTEVLGKKVKQISESKKIDKDRMYVIFKNNCPVCGSLYDDFRICDMNKNVVYTVIPARKFIDKTKKYKKYKTESYAYGRGNNFEEPLVQGSWKDVVKFFNN